MQKIILLCGLVILTICACNNPNDKTAEVKTSNNTPDETLDTLRLEGEKHLKNIRQLTFGGDNAEAYFSFDNSQLVFQSSNPKWDVECDQIYTMPVSGYSGERAKLVSTGKGRTTCAYFMHGDTTLLYASTHLGGDACPAFERKKEDGYVWPLFPDFDIFVADLEGNIVKQLTNDPGYDAEATVSPDGKSIVFTSTRSGDLELYTMDIDGSNVKQVTSGLGYDGGAFFSPDSKQLVFRASRPAEGEEADTYMSLLKADKVKPSKMILYVCDVDGSNLIQVTELKGANWAPFFHPSGKKIIFASNHHTESGRQFNLFSINVDGTGVEQITFDKTFDAFPMFSPDGKKFVFASNRNNGGTRDTNVFIADWVE